MRRRLVIRFAIDGDLRFISHHDTIRLFERAVARADIPVCFTQGFNPRPRLSLPVPRAVGVASDDETLLIEIEDAGSPGDALARLGPHLPAGVRLREAREAAPQERFLPSRVSYRIELTDAEAPIARARIDAWKQPGPIVVSRRDHRTGQSRPIDLRPFLVDVRADARSVIWTQALLSGGTARPAEIAEALGLDPPECIHRIRRIAVAFDAPLAREADAAQADSRPSGEPSKGNEIDA
ncbi:MAG: DUF2344 domain-containing protein [Phycisphaerae bacterium]|nr:TIGR03936 family radical SAM-associated protein [Phycisphaerae bacterium]NUQ47625.1 DUF2344 domain-containing protein [Phycisphaerae bacterium]